MVGIHPSKSHNRRFRKDYTRLMSPEQRARARALALALLACLVLAGCSSGALATYTNENGARGPEAVRILPWGGWAPPALPGACGAPTAPLPPGEPTR